MDIYLAYESTVTHTHTDIYIISDILIYVKEKNLNCITVLEPTCLQIGLWWPPGGHLHGDRRCFWLDLWLGQEQAKCHGNVETTSIPQHHGSS